MKNLSDSLENVTINQTDIFETSITIEQLEERLETTGGSMGESGTCAIM